MAHEISNVDGKDEAFYALQPAWHGLGTVLDFAPNSGEAIKAAHLDWEVLIEPIQTVNGIMIPGNVATIRSDTQAPLGVVSKRYHVIQNREVFNFLDSLLMDDIMKYESAGALKDGRIVWVLARMPSIDYMADGDACKRYILFTTAHDGSEAIHAIPTSVRVVCANTFRVATARDIGIRHTGDVDKKLEQAKNLLSQYDKAFTLFRDHARRLSETQMDKQEVEDYLNELFPSVDEKGKAQTMRDNKVKQIRGYMDNRCQNLPSIRGTWWSAYNAISEYHDHHSRTRGRDERDRKENNFISIVDGNRANLKNAAFDLAVEMAGV